VRHFQTFIVFSLVLLFIFYYFFLVSPFTTPGLSGTFAAGLFFPLFFLVVRRGSGVLSPATHAHRLFSYLLSGDTTRIQHNIHGRPIRPGFEPCRPRGGVGRNTHTHLWPSGGSFLGKNPPPSVRFEPTSAGTATSEHCLRQPCGHRATLFYYI
jgi:hypothetical protein